MRDGLVDQGDKFKKRIASADTSPYKVVEKNQLVVGFPIDEGVLAFQDLYPEAIVSPAYDIWQLKSPDQIDPNFFQMLLRSPRSLSYYTANLRSTTARRRTIPKEVFLDMPIPLPPLAEQQRIAARLDAADRLRALRRDAVAALDALTHSLFLEMFGDPMLNDKNWPTLELVDVCNLINGKAFKPTDWTDEGVPIIRIQNLNDSKKPFNYFKGDLPKKFFVHKGDILLSWSGTPGTSFGCFSWNGPEGWLNQHIFNVHLKLDWEKFFFIALVNAQLAELIAKAHGGVGLQHITKSALEQVKLMAPPLSLQREFAARLGQIETVRARMEDSRVSLDALFAALQSAAFEGENAR